MGKVCLTCGMNISSLVIDHFKGNKAELATAAGVSRQAVSQWDDDSELRAEYVIPVCAYLCWAVTPHKLRPDIYPNAADGLPTKEAA